MLDISEDKRGALLFGKGVHCSEVAACGIGRFPGWLTLGLSPWRRNFLAGMRFGASIVLLAGGGSLPMFTPVRVGSLLVQSSGRVGMVTISLRVRYVSRGAELSTDMTYVTVSFSDGPIRSHFLCPT